LAALARRQAKATKKVIAGAKALVKSKGRPVLPCFRISATGAACSIRAAEEGGEEGGKKLPSFTGRAYTGAPMKPGGWWTPIIVDLDGVKVPSQHRPALRQHSHEQIVGHTQSVQVSAEGIDVAGVFSGEPKHVESVVVPAQNGFQWQLSIGADPIRTEFLEAGEQTEVNGRTVTGPCTISRETELGEISFVPLGADGDTSATVSATKGGLSMFAKAALKLAMKQGLMGGKYSDEDIDKMSDDEAKAALKECMKAEEEKKAEGDDDVDADDEGSDTDTDVDADDEPAKAKAKAKSGKKSRFEAAVQRKLKAARAEAAAEVRRQNEIRARCAKFVGLDKVQVDGKNVDLVAHAIEHGWTADQTELCAMRADRGRVTAGVGVPGGLAYSTSTPQATEAVLEAAVLHALRHSFKLNDEDFYHESTPDGKGVMRRVPLYLQRQAQGEIHARYTDQVQQAAHTLFKGRITLKQVLIVAAQRAGMQVHFDLTSDVGVREYLQAWDRSMRIQAEGASDTSISNILTNVMNKFALQGYLFTEQSWRDVCGIRPVNDFKPTKSINLLGDVMFRAIGPTGELEHAAIADQAFANQAAPFGRILTIPWTHIVNDDLSILGTAPQKVGQGAGLALNDQIWTLWKNMAAGTVNGDDGVAFWRTTSDIVTANKMYKPNKQSGGGSVFGDAGLKAAKALFDNQIDPNGNPLGFDGLTPILLHGPSLWRDVTAQMQAPTIVYGGATAALAPNANVWQGRLKPVMSRYIENSKYGNSTTAWWVLFNPVALAVIEVAFLNGVDTPAVLQAGPDYQFDRLGISIRGTMPFGSSAQNFRGGVYSVGA